MLCCIPPPLEPCLFSVFWPPPTSQSDPSFFFAWLGSSKRLSHGFPRNILLKMNGRPSKICSVHLYIMTRKVYFKKSCPLETKLEIVFLTPHFDFLPKNPVFLVHLHFFSYYVLKVELCIWVPLGTLSCSIGNPKQKAERQRLGCPDTWPCNCKQTPSLWSPIVMQLYYYQEVFFLYWEYFLTLPSHISLRWSYK